MPYQTEIPTLRKKDEYKACSNCTLPVQKLEDDLCVFCKHATRRIFKSRTKLVSATAI